MVRCAVAAIAALFLCGGVGAAPLLDQSYLVDASGSYSSIGLGVGQDSKQADGLQTAIASLTGKLTALNLQLFNDTIVGTVELSVIGNIAIDPLTKAISGDPSAVISLAAGALPTTAQFRAGGLLSIDTSSMNVFLTGGELFGIFVRLNDQPQMYGIGWGSSFQGGSAGYLGGDAYFSVNGAATNIKTDAGFQTFVDTSLRPVSPSAVPEPATWAMLLLGFSMIGTVARDRRVANAKQSRPNR
jgi:hypothetical protein